MSKSNAHRKSKNAKTGKARVTKIVLRGKAVEVKGAKVPKFKYGTSRSGTGPKKAIPAGKVFPLRKYTDVLTIVRPMYVKSEDAAFNVKFRLATDGETIKVSIKGIDDKVVIAKTDHPTKPWRVTVPYKGTNPLGDSWDPTYHKSPFAAYKSALGDVWDISL